MRRKAKLEALFETKNWAKSEISRFQPLNRGKRKRKRTRTTEIRIGRTWVDGGNPLLRRQECLARAAHVGKQIAVSQFAAYATAVSIEPESLAK